jgi:hypothetical protein
MMDKLIYFKKQTAEAIAELPHLAEEINDIHDYCMLFLNDGLAVFSNELDTAISDLEQLVARNQEVIMHTDWLTEGETEYERNL